MADESRTVHRTSDEARGGSTPNTVRWVLGISLAAAIIALSAIWMFGAASQSDAEDEANVATRQTEAQAQEQQQDSTDSIVLPNNTELPKNE